jgi:holo-[acyl-carrier protein] synthase
MIRGIGVDIEEVARIRDMIARYEKNFLERIFTEREIQYCLDKSNPPMHFTARFAAKEAFSKAIGTGWRDVFRWKDVEIDNDPLGKPAMTLHNEVHERYACCSIHVSLSHTAAYAAAFVLLEDTL